LRADILLSFGLLCSHFLVTTVALRLARSISPVLIHLFSAIFAAMSLILITWLSLDTTHYSVWPGLSLLAFGAMAFLFAYSAIYKSISLRLLVEGVSTYPEAVLIDQLHDQSVLPRYLDRINLLVRSGHLQQEGELVAITSRGLKLCGSLNHWRIRLGFGDSGLYYAKKQY
jgi:hypothetical protein